jgi:hypothetical protein
MEDLGLDKIILKWMFKKWDSGMDVPGSCEYGSEPS